MPTTFPKCILGLLGKQEIFFLQTSIGHIIVYFGSQNILSDEVTASDWWPSLSEFSQNLSKEDWKKYLLEIELPGHPSPMQMLKAMMELGCEASCKQLAQRYGGTVSAYVGCAVNLGKRVKRHFGLPACIHGRPDGVRSRLGEAATTTRARASSKNG